MSDETTRTSSIVKLAAIPVILGLGAAVWLGVYIDAHYFNRSVSQEERRNEEVGAKNPPKEPIKFTLNHPADRCLKIEKAWLDGKVLTVYYRNNCHESIGRGIEIGWSGIAPDGTVVTSAEHFTKQQSLDAGQRAEYRTGNYEEFEDDERITSVTVWVRP